MDPTLDGARRRRPRPRRGLPVRAWIQAASRSALEARDGFPLLCRWTTHLSIVGLGIAAAIVNHSPTLADHPWQNLTFAAPPVADAVPLGRQTSSRGGTGYLVRAAVPRTTITDRPSTDVPAATNDQAAGNAPEPEKRGTVTYVVQPGDTVIGLAERFGVTPETILSANRALAGNPDLLQLGQELLILPVSGVLHEVAAGDTLVGIAGRYEVGIEAIIAYKDNNLSEPYVLHPGQKLVVPGGKWTYSAASRGPAASGVPSGLQVQATGSFIWPTTGRITQWPWARHVAIDLGTPTGTPIYAADAGYVVESGWSGVGYGQYVLLDHGTGFRTLYAHMSKRLVQRGQTVEKGQKIGLVGSTGNSTGPHLHFEIYKDGVLRSPLNYLPR